MSPSHPSYDVNNNGDSTMMAVKMRIGRLEGIVRLLTSKKVLTTSQAGQLHEAREELTQAKRKLAAL